MSSSLKKQAVRGTIWTVFGYGSSQVLRFGGNLILTRLLVPDLFGLMALVQVFIMGLNLFSDIGINPSIIRSDRGDDPVFLNTAWTLQAIRGFLLWIACLIIAWPVSNFYNDPRLLWLIPIVGLTTIISGFNSTSLASLNRHMEVGKLAVFELAIQIVSLIILIVWATLSPTIWALVAGSLISTFLKAIWSHRLNWLKPNRFAWNKEVIDEIASFGKWIFLSTAMLFLASQSDRIILGKFFTLEMLGIYVVAFTFADIPRQISFKIGNKVIFPTVSKMIDLSREQLRKKILQKRGRVVMLLAFGVSILCCFGDLIIIQLYDTRYEQASWMLPILALGIWPLLLCQTVNPILLAIGQPRYIALGNFFKFIYMFILLPIGILKMGKIGAIVIIAFNDLPLYLAVNYGLCREKLGFIFQDLKLTLFFLLLLILFLSLRLTLNLGFPIPNIL